MNEIWIYTVVTRTNINMLFSYHVNSWHHYVPHTKYLDQEIFTVVNGFIPNKNDNLGNESRSVKVWCVSVGSYEKVKESSYHRVYDDDRKFTCSKIIEHIMCQKGQKLDKIKIVRVRTKKTEKKKQY